MLRDTLVSSVVVLPTRSPKTRCGNLWTEARFWQFLRSALRRSYTRWPAQYQARNDARRPYCGASKKQKWEYQCATCKQWWPAKATELHHIVPVGSLKSYDDLPGFAERLFCEKEGLQVVCIGCHRGITKEQRAK